MKNNKVSKMRKVFTLLFAIAAILLVFWGNTKNAYAAKYSIKINVTSKEYGAKAGTDCTKAIQKALDTAAAKGTNKKPAYVSIPKGTYYISKPLVIGSNTILALNKNTVMKKTGNPIPLYMLMTKTGTKGGYKETENITISGGKWDTEYKKYNENWSGTTFFLVHSTNLIIKNVEFCNNFGTHFIEMGGINKATISGCKFHGFKYSPENKTKEAIQLDVNHDSDMMSGAGVFDDTSCNNITIKKCEFYDYPRAIGSHLAVDGVYHDKITIIDNKFHDIEKEPIYGYNYVNCTIKNNTFENIGQGIVLRNNDTGSKGSYIDRLPGVKATTVKNNDYNIVISNNTIKLNKNTTSSSSDFSKTKGIYISGGEGKPIKNVTIEDNVITSDTVGIHFNHIKEAKLNNNTINRNSSAYSTDSTSYTEEGIMLEDSEATVNSNMISNSSSSVYDNAIGVHSGSKLTIIDSKINGAAKKGISINGASSAEINNVTIDGCSNDYGLFVSSDAKVTVKNSEIKNSGKSGIYSEDSSLTCTNCKISSNEKSALTIKGSKVEISQNNMYGNKQRSITIMGGCSGSIKNNTFRSPNVSNELYFSGSNSFSPSVNAVNKKTISSYGGKYVDSCGNSFELY